MVSDVKASFQGFFQRLYHPLTNKNGPQATLCLRDMGPIRGGLKRGHGYDGGL